MKKILFFTLLLLIGACTTTQKLRDGKMAYAVKQYNVATGLLAKEFAKAKTRVEKGKIAFMIADCYQELNQSGKSIDWYQKAYDNQYGVDALREWAYALKKAERYDEAKEAFKNLGIEIGSPYEYKREIASCDLAAGWKKNKTPEYSVESLPFNSKAADYSPVFYKDNQLVITSDRSTSTGEKIYNWTGNDFSDLYIVNPGTLEIKGFGPSINTEDNEGTATFTKDYNDMYFTRCYGGKKEDAFCKLMYSHYDGSAWSKPEKLPFINDKLNYGHPSVSADGRYLYYACNDPEGWGGYDIYVVERLGEAWSDPKILSRAINSIGNEKFPYIDQDTLYFSSDFHPGMGGLDIFRSVHLKNGDWSPIINLKGPINSGGDDFGFIVDRQAKLPKDVLKMGYITSTRNDGQGNDDIYKFEQRYVPPPPVPVIPPKVTVKPKSKMILEGYVLEKIFTDATNPNSQVLGRKPLPGSKVDFKILNKPQTITVGEDGQFRVELEENTDYSFLASKDGYLKNSATFSTKGIAKDPNVAEQVFEIEVILDKIYIGREIRLENIYYDLDKWDIRDDAKPTLDALAKNLALNPTIRIQLASHTDCRASNAYNQDLSQKRAQSAVEYLISKGIDASRLEAKGYGETVPEANCLCTRCTEVEHQANRRTTFKIIE